jgi:hypothetical protein
LRAADNRLQSRRAKRTNESLQCSKTRPPLRMYRPFHYVLHPGTSFTKTSCRSAPRLRAMLMCSRLSILDVVGDVRFLGVMLSSSNLSRKTSFSASKLLLCHILSHNLTFLSAFLTCFSKENR